MHTQGAPSRIDGEVVFSKDLEPLYELSHPLGQSLFFRSPFEVIFHSLEFVRERLASIR